MRLSCLILLVVVGERISSSSVRCGGSWVDYAFSPALYCCIYIYILWRGCVYFSIIRQGHNSHHRGFCHGCAVGWIFFLFHNFFGPRFMETKRVYRSRLIYKKRLEKRKSKAKGSSFLSGCFYVYLFCSGLQKFPVSLWASTPSHFHYNYLYIRKPSSFLFHGLFILYYYFQPCRVMRAMYWRHSSSIYRQNLRAHSTHTQKYIYRGDIDYFPLDPPAAIKNRSPTSFPFGQEEKKDTYLYIKSREQVLLRGCEFILSTGKLVGNFL